MTIEQVHQEIEAALNKLRPLFIEEAELTFVMRVPGHPQAFMVISNDDLDEVEATIKRSRTRSMGVGR